MPTIIILDDERVVRQLITAILQREGYSVLQTQTAAEVQHLAVQHTGQIDLLITDHSLPNTTGRVVAEAFRRVRPTVKVLEISGYDKSQLEGELTRGSAFLQKPFSPLTLVQTVREVLTSEA